MASSQGTLSTIWKAVRQLNPHSALRDAERGFNLAVVGANLDESQALARHLLGETPDYESALSVKAYALPLVSPAADEVTRADTVIATVAASTPVPPCRGALVWDPAEPAKSAKTVSSRIAPDLRLSFARSLPGLRNEIARQIVREVCKENAVFVIATALGDVVPSVFSPLLGIAQAASDTAFLTANQVRMAFLLGGAYSREVGYSAQWREIASIVGASFGWRAIARELVAKIPFGGGLVPKGAISYAGTAAVGEGLIFYYTTGRHMTKVEMKQAFGRYYSEALTSVRALVGKHKDSTPPPPSA